MIWTKPLMHEVQFEAHYKHSSLCYVMVNYLESDQDILGSNPTFVKIRFVQFV